MQKILPFITKDSIHSQAKTFLGEEYIISGTIEGARAVYSSGSKSVKVFYSDFLVEYIEGDLINKVVLCADGHTDVWALNKEGEILAVDSIAKE